MITFKSIAVVLYGGCARVVLRLGVRSARSRGAAWCSGLPRHRARLRAKWRVRAPTTDFGTIFWAGHDFPSHLRRGMLSNSQLNSDCHNLKELWCGVLFTRSYCLARQPSLVSWAELIRSSALQSFWIAILMFTLMISAPLEALIVGRAHSARLL